MLKTASVISDHSREDEVGMDDIVEVEFEEDGEIEKYKLVTSIRGNSLENRVSIESPIGKALRGHQVGDRVEVKVNDTYSYFLIIRAIDKTGAEDERDPWFLSRELPGGTGRVRAASAGEPYGYGTDFRNCGNPHVRSNSPTRR